MPKNIDGYDGDTEQLECDYDLDATSTEASIVFDKLTGGAVYLGTLLSDATTLPLGDSASSLEDGSVTIDGTPAAFQFSSTSMTIAADLSTTSTTSLAGGVGVNGPLTLTGTTSLNGDVYVGGSLKSRLGSIFLNNHLVSGTGTDLLTVSSTTFYALGGTNVAPTSGYTIPAVTTTIQTEYTTLPNSARILSSAFYCDRTCLPDITVWSAFHSSASTTNLVLHMGIFKVSSPSAGDYDFTLEQQFVVKNAGTGPYTLTNVTLASPFTIGEWYVLGGRGSVVSQTTYSWNVQTMATYV